MADSPPLPSFSAIVVAAGQGLRAGGGKPKQFRPWRGKPVLRHSVDALREAGATEVIVVTNAEHIGTAQDLLTDHARLRFVTGGATRQQSVRNGLAALSADAPERVLIHDAARPDLPAEVIARLLAALDDHAGAIPVLPVVDSLIVADGDVMASAAQRAAMRRVQTPQAFRYGAISTAHAAWQGEADAGDDAQVLAAQGHTVGLVEGSERLAKLTFAEDFVNEQPVIRVGSGFDVHRLIAGEELWLAGVQVPHDRGLAGHSDADVALHALVDALLGAIGGGDIGTHFPPSDPQWRGQPSSRFVSHAVDLVAKAGYAIGNIDLTIVCEAPRIGPHRAAMRARLAYLLGIEEARISLKATTTEQLGFTGRGEGIAAQATVSLQRN